VNGGTLYLRGSDWHKTLQLVDTIIATPSILSRFHKRLYPNIKTIVAGGEPCPMRLADEWAVDSTFYNICGPTEITILNSAHRHIPGTPLSIGKPIPNTNVYVLDDNENPTPIGQVGTMWVGGSGVSRGYINLPGLTASRFKADKFTNDGKAMFNTGDLCRWREDGSLEHYGRNDDQIKFKGFRVELDGVSAAIERYLGITKACTLVINDSIWGFYSASSKINQEALRDSVAQILPYYSVPTSWQYQNMMPLTPNGKVDKKFLRSLVLDRPSVSAKPLALTIPPPAAFPSDKGLEKDLEKGSMESISPSSICSFEKQCYQLPSKNGFHGERWLRHRFFSLYRRLFSVILIGNFMAILLIVQRSVKSRQVNLADLATATSVNLLVSVLMRQDHVINLLFKIATSVPTWFPLSIRRHLARVYHIGGIHSGAAVAAVFWFLMFTASATRNYFMNSKTDPITTAALVPSYLILLLFIAILVMAHPTFRSRWHNQFEISHRFLGWSVLAILWVQTVLVTDSIRGRQTLRHALLVNPSLWVLVAATSSIVYPWLLLRRVTVRPEVLSNHAIRLHFDYCNTIPGTAVRISRSPLKEWHAFATIANPGVKGFSLIVSNAGDWTKETIGLAPTKIWKRGVPACGVLAISPLFKKIVLVATGSGIGPCLPVILAKKVPCRILWSTPNPQQTFGKEVCGAVLETDPEAIIHDTKTMGRPDLVELAYRMYRESDAEAVCIISNQKLTQKVVYAMESRGIPAFGAIWDS
jgi:NAD(P)H-flavin reductase